MVRISKYIVILVSLVKVIVLNLTKFVSKFCLIYYKKIIWGGGGGEGLKQQHYKSYYII